MTLSYDFLPLPTAAQVNYQYEAVLGDTTYSFVFNYRTREPESWYMSIYNLLGELLLSSVRMTPHINLLPTTVSNGLPDGELVLISKANDYSTPEAITQDNLSSNFNLVLISG